MCESTSSSGIDRVPSGKSNYHKEPRRKGHEDLIGIIDGDARAGGTACTVDGDGREAADEELLGRAGGRQDLDAPGVETVTDLLEELLDAQAKQAALLVQPDEAVVDGLGAEAHRFRAGRLQPVPPPERLPSQRGVGQSVDAASQRVGEGLVMVYEGLRVADKVQGDGIPQDRGVDWAAERGAAALIASRSRVSTECQRSSVAWLSTGTKSST